VCESTPARNRPQHRAVMNLVGELIIGSPCLNRSLTEFDARHRATGPRAASVPLRLVPRRDERTNAS